MPAAAVSAGTAATAGTAPSSKFPSLRPKFLLFGDSITQRGFAPDGGWGSAVADAYVRRVDVVNRGYSGYNTRWAMHLLEAVMPESESGSVELATVFFGANDAALADRSSAKQHVPLDEYAANLRSIISHFQSRGVPHIVILTPPPVHEPSRFAYVLESYGVKLPAPERTNDTTGLYAAAAVSVGADLGIPVVNLWEEFQARQGWERGLLSDGLHLTPAGNAAVAELLLAKVAARWPELRPGEMKWDVPEWGELAEAGAAGAGGVVQRHRLK